MQSGMRKIKPSTDFSNNPMKAKSALKWTIWTIAVLVILAAIGIFLIESHPHTVGRTERLPFYKLYLDALKAILISGLVALASVLIPAIISQANADFKKLKESRIAYSSAKTGIDYLPLRLSSLNLSEATAHIQQVHVYKHQAELYEELKDHLSDDIFQEDRSIGEMPCMLNYSCFARYLKLIPENGMLLSRTLV